MASRTLNRIHTETSDSSSPDINFRIIGGPAFLERWVKSNVALMKFHVELNQEEPPLIQRKLSLPKNRKIRSKY